MLLALLFAKEALSDLITLSLQGEYLNKLSSHPWRVSSCYNIFCEKRRDT